jgi:hypothetical protein
LPGGGCQFYLEGLLGNLLELQSVVLRELHRFEH